MGQHHSNIKSLKSYRKELRNNSTSAEAELWKMVKGRQVHGRKFRRQHSIGTFIVDFYCHEEKLIIELDGDCHGDQINIEKDIKRDEILESEGYSVLRFENRFVFQDPAYVLNEIVRRFK